MRHAFPPLLFNRKSIYLFKLPSSTLHLITNTDVPLVQNLGSSCENCGLSPMENNLRGPCTAPGDQKFGGGTVAQVGFVSVIPNPGGRRRAGKKKTASAPEAEQQPEERGAARPACPHPWPQAGGWGAAEWGTRVSSSDGTCLHLSFSLL